MLYGEHGDNVKIAVSTFLNIITSRHGKIFHITGPLCGESMDSSYKGPVMWIIDTFPAK